MNTWRNISPCFSAFVTMLDFPEKYWLQKYSYTVGGTFHQEWQYIPFICTPLQPWKKWDKKIEGFNLESSVGYKRNYQKKVHNIIHTITRLWKLGTEQPITFESNGNLLYMGIKIKKKTSVHVDRRKNASHFFTHYSNLSETFVTLKKLPCKFSHSIAM